MNQAYVLLDPAQIEHLPERLFELNAGAQVRALYQHTVYHALASLGPVLIRVQPHSELAQTFTREWAASAGIWLESEAPEQVLCEHLRSLIHARVEGGATVFFRYYDPRITALWLSDLPPSQRDRLMGPVRLIRLPQALHATGHICQETPQPAAQYAPIPWLALTAEQLEHLSSAKRQCFTRQLIEHGLRFFPEQLNALHSDALQQWAVGCQQSAARQGYSAIDEVMAWARLYAVLGEDFPTRAEQTVYRQLLAEPGVSPAQRLDNLNSELNRQLLTDKGPLA